MSSFQKIPLSKLIKPRSEQVMPNPDMELNYVGLDHIESSRFRIEEFGSSKEVKSSKFKFYPNDILYGKLRPYLDKAVLVDNTGICSTDIYAFQVRKHINPKYLLSLFHSKGFRDFVNSTTTGMNLPRTSWRKIKNFQLLIPFKNGKPDLDEQKRIADKIDKLFEEIDKGIEKTKQALKDSKNLLKSELNRIFGGDLSENWKKFTLGDVCDTTSGGTPRRNVEEYFGGEIPWLKSGELNDSKRVEKSEETITQKGLDNSSAKLFLEGTLLMAMYGATAGQLGILNIDAATNQAVCAITPKNKNINSVYIYWFLRLDRDRFLKKRFGTAQPNISQTFIKKLKILLPVKKDGTISIKRQQEAVDRIDKIQKQSQELQEKLEEQLKDFKMLKQSILNQAFQGKL